VPSLSPFTASAHPPQNPQSCSVSLCRRLPRPFRAAHPRPSSSTLPHPHHRFSSLFFLKQSTTNPFFTPLLCFSSSTSCPSFFPQNRRVKEPRVVELRCVQAISPERVQLLTLLRILRAKRRASENRSQTFQHEPCRSSSTPLSTRNGEDFLSVRNGLGPLELHDRTAAPSSILRSRMCLAKARRWFRKYFISRSLRTKSRAGLRARCPWASGSRPRNLP